MEGIGRGIGKDVVNSGIPLNRTKVITLDGIKNETDPNTMKGFAVANTESIEAAVQIAQSVLVLDIEVVSIVPQMMEMVKISIKLEISECLLCVRKIYAK